MKKRYLLLLPIILIIGFVGFIFISVQPRYNDKVLNDIKGGVLYLERDESQNLSVYYSDADMNSKVKLINHKDATNSNILDFSINTRNLEDYKNNNYEITYTGYSSQDNSWNKITLKNGEKINEEQTSDKLVTGNKNLEDYIKLNEDYSFTNTKNNNVYLVENGKVLIKTKEGTIEVDKSPNSEAYGKFNPEPSILYINDDYIIYNKTVFNNATLNMLAGMVTGTMDKTYIYNIKTGENSEYIYGTDFVFLKE